jgi:hypothetical protein
MGLNCTSTKPSVIEAFFFTHQGKVPLPDCLSTFGGLGADAPAAIAHFGEPLPVTPHVQSAGGAPGLIWSNVSAPARAAIGVMKAATIKSPPFNVLFTPRVPRWT